MILFSLPFPLPSQGKCHVCTSNKDMFIILIQPHSCCSCYYFLSLQLRSFDPIVLKPAWAQATWKHVKKIAEINILLIFLFGSSLWFFPTKSSSKRVDMDWKGRLAHHRNSRKLSPGSMSAVSAYHPLPPAIFSFYPPSILWFWQKVCILEQTPVGVMDMRTMFEMETYAFCSARGYTGIPQ